MADYKIIFIGGVPGVGKTSISGALSRKYNIDIMLSGDYLREFARPIIPSDNQGGILMTSVYEAWKNFGEKTEENIIKGYLEQSKPICNGINAVIERADKNGENVIVESLYLNQELIDTLKKYNACSAYIYISDWDLHSKRLNERELYTHKKSPGNRLSAQLDVYRTIMDYSVNLLKKNNIKIFDNLDYSKTREDIIKFVGDYYGID